MLANRFKVSLGSITSGIKILAAEGLVKRVPGSGVYVGEVLALSDGEGELLPGKRKAEQIAEDLKERIIDGVYRAGTFLPQQKSLVFEYRSGPKTVTKALRVLAKENLLTKIGTGYVIGTRALTQISRGKSIIYYIGEHAGYSRFSVGYLDLLKSFESELEKVGIRIVRYFSFERRYKEVLAKLPLNETLGFLHYGVGLKNFTRALFELKTLAVQKLPVVWFNFNCIYPLIDIPKNVSVIRFHNENAGEEVGSHLAMLGHKHVAYLSLHSENIWCKDRLRGLQKRMHSIWGSQHSITTVLEQKSNPVPDHIKETALEKLRSGASVAANNYPFTQLDPTYGTSVFSDKGKARASGTSMLGTISLLVEMDANRALMRPHFEQVLKDRKITAWICSNQILSAAAEDFLRGKGVRLPIDLSLIGIDTDNECMLRRITTFDFRKDRLGYIAAHSLLGDLPLRRKKNGIVDCPGEIVVRESTGKAKA